jgi:hypothetical protein
MFTFGKFQVQEKLFAIVAALVFSATCVSAAVGPAAVVEGNAPVQLASLNGDARA